MEAPSNVKGVRKEEKGTPTPVCAKNYDIILGGSIFITLLAMPSSAPFKSTTSYGILLSKRLGIRGPKFGRANREKKRKQCSRRVLKNKSPVDLEKFSSLMLKVWSRHVVSSN